MGARTARPLAALGRVAVLLIAAVPPGSAALAGAMLATAAPAVAQSWPTRPIRMVMPNAPGSSVDTVGRITALGLGEELGQRVVIDNRPGAGGTLGLSIARMALPDGYTLAFVSPAALAVAPFLQRPQPYDPMHDFEFVATVGVTPSVLIVNAALPAYTVADLIALARVRKGELNMASAGPGSQGHLAGALLLSLGGFESLHVPFKGGTTVPSVMSGESHWGINPAPSVLPILKLGKVRAIAHTLPRRTPLLPDLPAIAEAVPGYSYSAWYGVIAPLRTPQAVVGRVNAAVAAATARPEVETQLASQATERLATTPARFRELVRETIEQNLKLIKAIGLSVDR